MKLYTLTYDCNKPVQQQVNIPTNTDYKLGVKVKRNGEMQSLSPDNVKLYTGETYTIEPTDLSVGQSSSLASGNTAVVIAGQNTTDIAGQDVDARNVFVEASYDDGATWSKLVPSGEQAFIVRVNDRSAGTNNWIAYADLADPNRKWHLYEGGVDSGKTTQTLKMPSVVWLVINGPQAGSWGLTQYPAVIRIVVGIGGGTFEKYIEPDTEKINGYLTFTLSSGDEASYTNQKIDIQHGFDDTVVEYFSKQNTGTGTMTLNGELSATAESLGLTGKTVDAENFYIGAVRSANEEPTDTEVLSTLANPFYSDNTLFQNRFPVRKANGGYILTTVGPSRNLYINEAKARGQYKDGDGAIFFYSPDSTGQNWYPTKTYTFEPTDIISLGWGKLQAGKWCKFCIDMNFGTPFTAKFDLNTNIFKSQQGDIGEASIGQKTVNISGKFSDNTDFNYDFVVA